MKIRLMFLLAAILSVPSFASEPVRFGPAPGTFPGGTNVTASATLGANIAPAIDAGNWTCGAGWDCSVAGTLNKNADGVGTAVPNPALTIVAGTTYRVDITLGAVTVASGATWTLGGVSGIPLTAATTYTDYVTATTTGNLVVTPTPTGTRFTITTVSVRALTNATGDLTVDGNLTVNSGSLFRASVLVPDGGEVLPGFAFWGSPGTGIWRSGASVYVSNAGVGSVRFAGSGIGMPSGNCIFWSATTAVTGAADLFTCRDAASTLQVGIDAATASAHTLKGPDSTGAGVKGGDITIRGGAGTGTTNPAGGNTILAGGAPNGSGPRGVVVIEDGGTKPTCAAGIRGAIWYDAGGAGVLDTFEVCRKDASNNYAWVTLF